MLLAVAGSAGAQAGRPTGFGTGGGSHTIVVVLENRELSEVIGAAEGSALGDLAERGALATNYHAIAHPSLPNYLALLGGSSFGIDDDCTDCHASGANLATQLSAAGISWRAYMGGMPGACFRGAEAGEYVKRHNPFMYFPSIVSRPRLCRRVVPETALERALAEHDLPSFAWIGPGLCDDGHSCDFSVADEYLKGLLPRLLAQLGPHGLLIVSFDEGTSDSACCGGADGGRVATILAGPEVRRGVRLPQPYSHYSLLATLEDRFGVPRLRRAGAARSLTAAFRTRRPPPGLRPAGLSAASRPR